MPIDSMHAGTDWRKGKEAAGLRSFKKVFSRLGLRIQISTEGHIF